MKKVTYAVKAFFAVTGKYHHVVGGFLTREEANYQAKLLSSQHQTVTFCVQREA